MGLMAAEDRFGVASKSPQTKTPMKTKFLIASFCGAAALAQAHVQVQAPGFQTVVAQYALSDPTGTGDAGRIDKASTQGAVDAGDPGPASYRLVLPQGARIWLSFTEAISSKTASPGDPVILELVNELKIGDATVAEAGHKVYGKVLSVSRAHAPGLSGELEIQISPLELGRTAVQLRSPTGQGHGSCVEYKRPFALRWPLGLFRPGDDIEIAADTPVAMFVAESVAVPSLP
jgi:hypothetical protein